MRHVGRTGFCGRQLDARGECLAFLIRCLTVARRGLFSESLTRTQLHVSEPGRYYLLITSEPHGPTLVGHTRNFIGYIASPVGKIRVGVTKKE